ncbi:MAG TPA: NAD(P)H-binding protein [Gemmatimonadaceae bacterium]|nr:NAD(P)H-binding protein [Gemmatimonadaceae bacterium]
MRIFIAGATGVVGRRVVPALLDAGHSVTAVARSAERRAQLEARGAQAVTVSLFDQDALARVVRGHEVVINLATHIPSTSRMFLPGAWRENDRLRREGVANLVGAATASRVARFIQESFAPVYPDRGAQWIDESTPLRQVRYNRSVADAEASAAQFSGAGRAAVVLRFAGFYGPDSTQLADMIRYVRKGRSPLPGPEGAYISSVSHDDAAAAVLAALGAPAGVYNVVDDEPVTHRAYVGAIACALRLPAPTPLPRWVTRLMGSLGEMASRSVRIANRRLKDATGWAPAVASVRDGLPPCVDAIEEARARAAAA